MSSTGSPTSPWLEDLSRGFLLVLLICASAVLWTSMAYSILDHSKHLCQPWDAYYAIVVVFLLAITNGYTIFFPGAFTASGFLVSHVVFAIFFELYFDHKIWYRTPWMVPAADIDEFSGKDEINRLCEEEVEELPRNWLEMVWWWIA